jgi:hypothetical protein
MNDHSIPEAKRIRAGSSGSDGGEPDLTGTRLVGRRLFRQLVVRVKRRD